MLVELLLFVVLLAIILFTSNKKYIRFKGSGVPFETPFPFVGNMWRSSFKKIHAIEEVRRLYNDVGDESCRFVGVFSLTTPVIMLKDPDIIKEVAVKDFDFFTEHDKGLDASIEPLISKTLVSLEGQTWKDMRAALSPAFTSSKMRDMCPFISECAKQMTDYINERCKDGSGSAEIDARDLSTRFMNDVIATTAFGIKVDSFKDQNNEFYQMGASITKFGTASLIKILFVMAFPKIAKFFKMRIFTKKMDNFFRELIIESIKYREENAIVRRDMVQLLMEAKQGSLKHEPTQEKIDAFATVEESEIGKLALKRVWSDDELIAQALLFFFAGYETGATLMTFLLHELALNPDVHDKLKAEVRQFHREHGANVSYEVMQQMKYLDMVISEGLRKWPPAAVTDRRCVKDTSIGPIRYGANESYMIKKGEIIFIPIYGLHLDPKYYPNPTKFDPERFSDENKHKIQPFTFLPFGVGPRNCIGSRFALMEAKLMLYHIMSEFDIIRSGTNKPLELDRKDINMRIPSEFTLKFGQIEK